jgi:hypothetical protein
MRCGVEALVADLVVVPSQWWAGSSRPDSPERRLLLAVLVDALRCALGADPIRHQSAFRRERARQQALAWLQSDCHTSPFQFVALCDALDLDPEAIRAAIAGRRVRSEWLESARARRANMMARRCEERRRR